MLGGPNRQILPSALRAVVQLALLIRGPIMQALSQNIEAKVHIGWPTDPQSDDAICGCVDDEGT
jgi:hypothetical protein